MTTLNVVTYIWHDNLAAKREHSSELQELSDFAQIWHKIKGLECLGLSAKFLCQKYVNTLNKKNKNKNLGVAL
jgi:hypothetical protein